MYRNGQEYTRAPNFLQKVRKSSHASRESLETSREKQLAAASLLRLRSVFAPYLHLGAPRTVGPHFQTDGGEFQRRRILR